jgi:hypothetical protein
VGDGSGHVEAGRAVLVSHRAGWLFGNRSISVPNSVLEAIKLGLWDFEPKQQTEQERFRATGAMPGTSAKLDVLAERVRLGLPLWHPSDRQDFDEENEAFSL